VNICIYIYRERERGRERERERGGERREMRGVIFISSKLLIFHVAIYCYNMR
jgi:hypothetical protein